MQAVFFPAVFAAPVIARKTSVIFKTILITYFDKIGKN